MSVTVNISPRQLQISVFKMALALAGIFVLIGLGLAFLAGEHTNVALYAFFASAAFYFLSNGVLVALKVVDWFEDRKRRHG